MKPLRDIVPVLIVEMPVLARGTYYDDPSYQDRVKNETNEHFKTNSRDYSRVANISNKHGSWSILQHNNDQHYIAYNHKTREITHSLIGKLDAHRNFQEQDNHSFIRHSGLAVQDIYHKLLKNGHFNSVTSSIMHSGGTYKTWQRLSQKPGITLTNPEPWSKGTNLEAKTGKKFWLNYKNQISLKATYDPV